jgi:hypothetical protein
MLLLFAATARSDEGLRLGIDNAGRLIVPALSTQGALLIYQAREVSFTNGAVLVFACATPFDGGLIPLDLTNGQSFYRAAHWPGRSVTGFYGPEIEGQVWEPLGHGAFGISILAHLGSNPQQALPDRYKIEVLRFDRTPMPGVVWTGTDTNGSTGLFASNLQRASYTFQVPDSESAAQMIVRASSCRFTNICQEVHQGVVCLAGQWWLAPASNTYLRFK